MANLSSVLESVGEVYILSRHFFTGKDGEKVRAVALYVPETHSTINLYGDRNCLPFDAVPEEAIGMAVPHTVFINWHPFKGGFKPRVVSVD